MQDLLKARLILLPGFVSDRRVFDGLKLLAAEIHCIEYRWPVKGRTFGDYAEQLAGEIPLSNFPTVLCGYSMGAMIAHELCLKLKTRPKGVIMLASSENSRAIAPLVRLTGLIMSKAPLWMVRKKLRNPPRGFKKSLGSHNETSEGQNRGDLCRDMMIDSDEKFAKWAAGVIVGWKGCDIGQRIKKFHIHGGSDDLIRSSHVKPDIWIDQAGHVSLLDHVDEVSGFINESIAKCI